MSKINLFLVALAGMCAVFSSSVPVAAGVYYVDQTAPTGGNGAMWSSAFVSVDAAFDAILDVVDRNAEIRIAQGTYHPTLQTDADEPRSVTFTLPEGVSLLGGFAGLASQSPDERNAFAFPTTLSGDLLQNDGPHYVDYDDNAFVLIVAEELTNPILVDGLHIVSGFGAIRNSGSELTVRNCIIARHAGRAGTVINHDGVLTIEGCIVEECQSWEDNPVWGALRSYGESRVFVDRSVFSRNTGGGLGTAIQIDAPSVAVFTNSVISHNFGRGPAIYNGGRLTMTNCAVVGNAFRPFLPEPNNGTAGFVTSGNAAIQNCIFWANETNDGTAESSQLRILESPGIDVLLSHNCVQGWTGTLGGVSNIGDDPRFVDVDGPDGEAGTNDDDLRLRSDSPCIDAGSNDVDTDISLPGVQPIPELDLLAGGRFADAANTADTGEGVPPIVDIGPIERDHAFIQVSSNSVTVNEGNFAVLGVWLSDSPGGSVTIQAEAFPVGPFSATAGTSLEFDDDNFQVEQYVTIESAIDIGFVNDRGRIRLSSSLHAPQDIPITQQDVTPTPEVLFVKHDATGNRTGISWDDALTSIQDALDIIEFHPDIGEVWVARGEYHPTRMRFLNSRRSRTFQLSEGLKFRGGFDGTETSIDDRVIGTHETKLSGDFDGDDVGPHDDESPSENALNIVTVLDSMIPILIDGFTIEGGNANRSSSQPINQSGAGILIQHSNVVVRQSRIQGNLATLGAGLTMIESDVLIQDSGFCSNQSSSRGGAVHNEHGILTIENTQFEGNLVTDYNGRGGAIYGIGDIAIFDCEFVNNAVSTPASSHLSDGGALFVFGDTAIQGSAFIGNYAYSGGAIVHGDQSLTICDSQFIQNIAEEYAGAIRSYASVNGRIENCVFDGNRLIGDGRPTAAAILAGDTPPDIIDCDFVDNRAMSPWSEIGAVGVYASDERRGLMRGCRFEGNAGAEWGVGVAHYYDIERCTFIDNSGSRAGALDVENTRFIACRFLGNRSIGSIFGDGEGSVILGNNSTMTNCLVSGNQSETAGGVTCDGDTGVAIINCTMFGNHATNGPSGIRVTAGQPLVLNTIFDNTGAALAGDADVRFCRTDIDVAGIGNIHHDPQFIDAWGPDGLFGTLDDDPRIADTSPCVNAGNSLIGSLPDADIDGAPRIVACRVDMGATETAVMNFEDCDGNGEHDDCQLLAGGVADCNENLQLDSCEIQLNPDADMNSDNVLDECQILLLRVNSSSITPGDGSSWGQPLVDLQEALAIARNHSGPVEIWVAAGVYLPASSNAVDDAFEIRGDISIYGGFSGDETERSQRDFTTNKTVLSADYEGNDDFVDPCCDANPQTDCNDAICRQYVCEYQPECCTEEWDGYCIFLANSLTTRCDVCRTHDDNADRIVDLSFTSASAVVDGFTIRGAHHRVVPATAVNVVDGFATIRNCRILDTRGTALRVVESNILMESCEILETRPSQFGEGYGVYIGNGCDVVMRQCLVKGTSPIGINLGGGSLLRIDRSRVEGSRPAIDVQFGAKLHASELAVTGSWSVGAIRAFGAELFLDRCTIAGNLGIGVGLGGGGSLIAFNSIMWGNEANGTSAEWSQVSTGSPGEATVDIRHCCIQHLDTLSGGGNIGTDPDFMDLEAGDLRLQVSSSCGDAGEETLFIFDITTDIDGVGRPIGCGLDIGAYEIITGEPSSGDFDGDGFTTILDIDALVSALLSPTPLGHCVGDLDNNGSISGLDITGFAEIALHGE